MIVKRQLLPTLPESDRVEFLGRMEIWPEVMRKLEILKNLWSFGLANTLNLRLLTNPDEPKLLKGQSDFGYHIHSPSPRWTGSIQRSFYRQVFRRDYEECG